MFAMKQLFQLVVCLIKGVLPKYDVIREKTTNTSLLSRQLGGMKSTYKQKVLLKITKVALLVI